MHHLLTAAGGSGHAIDWPAFVTSVDLLLPERTPTGPMPVWQASAPDPEAAAEATERRREELLSCM